MFKSLARPAIAEHASRRIGGSIRGRAALSEPTPIWTIATCREARLGCTDAPGRTIRRPNVLNRYDRSPPMAGEAEIKYLDGDFRIVRPGAFVRCAVTGVPIPLEELKYWSVDLQEAYASPDAGAAAVLSRSRPSAEARLSAAPRAPPPTGSTAKTGIAAASSKASDDRQRLRACGQRRNSRIAAHPRPGPFRSSPAPGHRARPVRTGYRLRHAVAVVVGKAARRRNRDAGGTQCREEFLRIADAGKRQHAPRPLEPR